MQRKNPEHYVDNKEFLQHMIEFKDITAKAREEGEVDPRIPDVIGEIFVKIASHLSFKSNFINYAFREDMIVMVLRIVFSIYTTSIQRSQRIPLPILLRSSTMPSCEGYKKRRSNSM